MSALPKFDPNWRRKPPPPPKPPNDGLAIAVFVIVVLVLYVARRESNSRDAPQIAHQPSNAASAAALQRIQEQARRDQLAVQRTRAANRPAPAPSPWTDVESASGSTRQRQYYEQARARAQGEADLRREQQRFSELTGQAGYNAQPHYATTAPAPANQCAFAKARRDEAYRLVGNNRTFEFIRQWDDYVYEACKQS